MKYIRFIFWIHNHFSFQHAINTIFFPFCVLYDRKYFNNSRKLFIIPLKLPNICLPPPIVWQPVTVNSSTGNHFSIPILSVKWIHIWLFITNFPFTTHTFYHKVGSLHLKFVTYFYKRKILLHFVILFMKTVTVCIFHSYSITLSWISVWVFVMYFSSLHANMSSSNQHDIVFYI